MSLRSTLALAVLVTMAQAQSLTVLNKCSKSVFLYTQTSFGSINNNVNVAAGASANVGISSNWDGAINDSAHVRRYWMQQCGFLHHWWSHLEWCDTVSGAESNFYAIPGSVTYDISLIYGHNVGMKISLADTSCDAFACTISSGCPVPGPDSPCYSPCCSSVSACSGGALPAGGGGCANNAGPGPNSPFYYDTCYNAYAFPDNDGANGYKPADLVVYTCHNTAITLTFCPGTTSSYH
ncbi:Osmotin thaumatin-like protein [Boletus coccyginus]|nr:Osmotin thaumatin-like protein [Boletus coccyginus]